MCFWETELSWLVCGPPHSTVGHAAAAGHGDAGKACGLPCSSQLPSFLGMAQPGPVSSRGSVHTECRGARPAHQTASLWFPSRQGHTHQHAQEVALLHGKGLATTSMLAHERAPSRGRRENMALEGEHSGVGVAAAFPWTPAQVLLEACILICCFRMSLHLNAFLAHAADYVLYGTLSCVLEALSMFLPQKNIIFDRYSPCGHSLAASDCWEKKWLSTSPRVHLNSGRWCWQWWIFSC